MALVENISLTFPIWDLCLGLHGPNMPEDHFQHVVQIYNEIFKV